MTDSLGGDGNEKTKSGMDFFTIKTITDGFLLEHLP
jgi:hypothetical protein